MASKDSYEAREKHLQTLFNEASTPESSQDPYADDGEFGSDRDYQPSGNESSSSEEDATNLQIRKRQNRNVLPSGESHISSSESDKGPDDDTTTSEFEDGNENFRHSRVANVSQTPHDDDLIGLQPHREEDLSGNCQEILHSLSNVPNMQTLCELDRDEGPGNPQEISFLPNIIQSATSSNELQDELNQSRPETSVTNESWSETVEPIPDFNFDDTTSGIAVNINNMDCVLEFFHLVFPRQFVDYIVTCTNTYGNALCHSSRPHTRHSRKAVYRETNSDEMMKFLGICLLKGQIKCPKQRNLFTYTNPLYFHPVFGYTMSGRRYEQLLRCVCASELDAKGENKIVKFIDSVTLNFRKIYNPDEQLSLDESLILFRGRLHFRQYIKSKKSRYGIKFYELTTHDGYVLNIKMYSGQEQIENENVSKTERLVLRLMRPYLLRGHHIFMDNFYNSVSLSQKLLDLKTHSTGTLRTNRKDNPKHLVTKKLKKGEHVWLRKNKIYVSKWKDKRPVLMINTKQHPSIVEVRNRFGVPKLKPTEVGTYNQYMSGIDRVDQMCSYYSSPRKTIRWYKKVLFHILDVSVWNAFYLYKKYKKNNTKSYGFVNYREELIKKMIGMDSNIKGKDLVSGNNIHDSRRHSRVAVPEVNPQEVMSAGHWPEQVKARDGTSKKFAFLKCKTCTKKKIRKETSYRCGGCSDKPPLCPSCFKEYHEDLVQ